MTNLKEALLATPLDMRLPLLIQSADDERDNAFVDMADTGNILICGPSGVGKSTLMHHMISSLIYAKSPQDLKIAVLDGNGTEQGAYIDLKGTFLIGHPVNGNVDFDDPKDALDVIEWINHEVMRRLKILKSTGVKNIEDFNKDIAIDNSQKLPHIVLFIDNYPDLIECDSERFESAILAIGQLGKSAGVHFVCITNHLTHTGLPHYILAYTDTIIRFHIPDTKTLKILSYSQNTENPTGTGYYKIQSRLLPQSPILYIDEIDKDFDLPDLIEAASQLEFTDTVREKNVWNQIEETSANERPKADIVNSCTEVSPITSVEDNDTTSFECSDEGSLDGAPNYDIKFDWSQWDQYKNSHNGKDKIEQFRKLLAEKLDYNDALEIAKDFDDPFFKNAGEQTDSWFVEMLELFDAKAGWLYNEMLKNSEDEEINPTDFVNILILLLLTDAGENINKLDEIPQARFKWLLQNIMPLSFALFHYMPDYFLPNLYTLQFENFVKATELCGLDLPDIPKKSDYRNRCLYYIDLSYLLNAFAGDNEIYDPADVCAFFFDFLPSMEIKCDKVVDDFFGRSAWLLIGNKYENEKDMDYGLWQANSMTKKGDLLFFYEKSPVKAMNSVWICRKDGIKDPFFWGYSYAYIGKCHENGDESNAYIEIPKNQWITFEDFKNSEYFKNRSSKGNFVSKNFQDTSGWEINRDDFDEILRLFKEKGFNISLIPEID